MLVTISGLSAGAFMAHQLHVAYSEMFKGAAFIAGGPYFASKGSLSHALSSVLGLTGLPDTAFSISVAREADAEGKIAPLANLRSSRVWVFHGRADTISSRSAAEALVSFYDECGNRSALEYVYDLEVGHAMPVACEEELPPYFSNCGFDAAGSLLAHLYGPLRNRASSAPGELRAFSQLEFNDASRCYGLAERGLVYLPIAALAGRKCGLHVALHGCQQTLDDIGDGFARMAGYNEWAEANDLIVLYPQVSRSYSMSAFNPLGAWDWWGYSDPDFHLRAGGQMQSIASMVQTLCGTSGLH
ncbi:depolymerase [Cupriavidus sp. P-10]|uniref:extracellular catalytic domain type 2 short-chain-length polyhydroxyalkanoate depolymerase n=1 Tax=unclassified Cupriavidus TaxID=2640874 RepID=UPI0013144636|nr:depolymerase [Cupriavidus sp. P-10]